MIPTPRLLAALLLWCLVGLAASIWQWPEMAWLLVGAAIALVSVVDLLAVAAKRPLIVHRTPDSRYALGVDGHVELEIVNRGFFAARIELFDGLPAAAESEEMPWQGQVPRKGFVKVRYAVKLMQRGMLDFTPAHLRRLSPMGLWKHASKSGPINHVRVYPNYEPVIRYSLLAIDHNENQMGIVRRNRQGLSREFHQLRDYHEGDLLSQIDWNASSKRLQIISREYREQRDQNIVVMVDSGRRMRAMDGDLPQFDHCLNAILLMSFIALRQGDYVGVLGFGGSNRWLPPVKGQHSMTTLLNHLYDYQTTKHPSDFAEAAERLMIHQRRRALVIVLTNLRSEDAGDVLPALRSIQRRHLVLLASLRESSVLDCLTKHIQTFDDALLYGATNLYLENRRRVFQEMRAHGMITLDETAQNLPIALTNAYFEIKNSGRL